MTEATEAYSEHLGKDWADYEADKADGLGHSVSGQRPQKRNAPSVSADYQTTGWEPTCRCECADRVPATVLDPYSGTATTGVVAAKLGRSYIGIELSPAYAQASRVRLGLDYPREGLLSES